MGINCIRAQKTEPNAIFLYQNMVKPITDTPFRKDFKLLECLGKGSYAEVFKAQSLQTKNLRAIKRIDRKKYAKLEPILFNQFEILKEMDHPNILKVYQIYQEPSYYYIVTELCTGKQLYQILAEKKCLSEQEACIIFYQIASSVLYMHEHHVMHRDIKPENMMYNTQTKILKMIDFGSSVIFEGEQMTQKRRVGTCYYIAPQVLEKAYNHKCDVWSVGVVLYVLLSGEPPFKARQDNEILEKVKEGVFGFSHKNWQNISLQAKMLIKEMLTMNPQERPQMRQVMKHDWITKFLKKDQLDLYGRKSMEQVLKNMKKYKEIKPLGIQSGILIFIVNFIKNSNDQNELIRCFKELDLNGDGLLSRQELTIGISKYLKLPPSQAQLIADGIFRKVDTNFSNFIDYSQFVVSASNIEMAVTSQNLDIAFDFLDKDKNGYLSASEFREKLGENLPEEAYAQLLSDCKVNSNGQISKKDFIEMMKKFIKRIQ